MSQISAGYKSGKYWDADGRYRDDTSLYVTSPDVSSLYDTPSSRISWHFYGLTTVRA